MAVNMDQQPEAQQPGATPPAPDESTQSSAPKGDASKGSARKTAEKAAESVKNAAQKSQGALKSFFVHLPKIDPDGRIVILAAAVLTILLYAIWPPLVSIGIAAVVLAYVGFRDPDRMTFEIPTAAMAPVDGQVAEIDDRDPPPELRLPPGDYNRIRVASSPFSVSTWRAPVAGQICALTEQKGKVWNIALEPDDEDNNKFLFGVTNAIFPCGAIFLSGGIVPRFIADVELDTAVVAGARIGQRLYGGWCDVYVPVNAMIQVVEGQTLVAGETIIARLDGAPPPAAAPR